MAEPTAACEDPKCWWRRMGLTEAHRHTPDYTYGSTSDMVTMLEHYSPDDLFHMEKLPGVVPLDAGVSGRSTQTTGPGPSCPCTPREALVQRAEWARLRRSAGLSIPSIAEEMKIGWATVWRYLRDAPAPALVEGRNGRRYKPRRNVAQL